MKSEKNILIAFILNIGFSIFELLGGFFTNSISIMSDAIHDFGDALSIGISLALEKISKKKPNEKYTYGYVRYSILGALITTIILTIGSIFVIIGGVNRIINPEEINYNGMIIFAVFGVIINLFAAYFTKDGDSINQRAVNLHMLEDVLGWIVVLVGAILMKFTDIRIIDSIMSIGVALFILVNSFKNLKEILDLFLEKTPKNISIEEINHHISEIKGVIDVHHIHIWSIDGNTNYATMHIVTDRNDLKTLKEQIREEMLEHGVIPSTIELENNEDKCNEKVCDIKTNNSGYTHHHHHH